jgi:hypothetical protein
MGGRPFMVEGQQRIATVKPHQAGVSNACIAAAWRNDALMEHASVASFARLTLLLLHHGAPIDLVAAAQAASLDEVRHAQICKDWGQKLTGDTWSFGPLSVADSLGDSDLLTLARQNVVEGCIGETLATCVVGSRASHATDPSLRRDLTEIADDEARHSVLAFKILAWTLTTTPLASAILETFQHELDQIERLPLADVNDPITDPTCGHLPEREAHLMRAEVCTKVLRPLLNELKATYLPDVEQSPHTQQLS